MDDFFKKLVCEHGANGIRANCVAPGPIDTPMLRGAFGDEESTREALSKLVKLVPLRRLGKPEEVAAAVRFLCSEGEFVAGQHLSVGGGVSMH